MCTQVLEGHTNKVWSVAVLDEATLLSCSSDMTIRVWDTATWTCRRVVDGGHTGYAARLAVHDGVYTDKILAQPSELVLTRQAGR